MPDDGNFKGHGGKGRKSKVVSINAHKSRHHSDPGPYFDKLSGEQFAGSQGSRDNFSGEKNSARPLSNFKKLTGLTLFDFSPSEFSADFPDEAEKLSFVKKQLAGLDPFDQVDNEESDAFDGETTVSLVDALPCENTPFERNLDAHAEAPAGRKYLRWGLHDSEDGGESLSSETVKEKRENQHTRDKQQKQENQRAGRISRAAAWQKKTGASGSLVESFYHALNGLNSGFETQRNVRIHCAIASGVLVLTLALKVDTLGCLALILATGFVLFAEYINTAVEHVTDIQANFQHHASARLAKDTAAAAVMIATATAVLIGAVVFAPRLWALACGTL